MPKYKTFLLPLFIAAFTLSACNKANHPLAVQDGGSVPDTLPRANSTAVASPNPTPASTSTPLPSPLADYKATGGDTYTLQRQSKAWTSAASEPSAWTDGAQLVSTVVGLYNSGMLCDYQVSEDDHTTVSKRNLHCQVLACGSASTDCTQKSLAARDFGIFKGAQGQETVCKVVSQYVNPVTSKTVRTISVSQVDEWTQSDVLRDRRVVHQENYTCMLTDDGSTDAKLVSPCTASTGVTFSRYQETVTDQTAGKGTPNLTTEPKSDFAVSGSFTEPAKTLPLAATCTLTGATMSVSLSKQLCNADNSYSLDSLTISGLPGNPVTGFSTGAYGVMFYDGKTSYMATTAGACTVDLSADSATQFITGAATCPNSISASGSSSSVQLKSISFSCVAPSGFSYAAPSPTASPSPSATPSPTPTVTPSATPSATPSPTPSPTPTPTPPAPGLTAFKGSNGLHGTISMSLSFPSDVSDYQQVVVSRKVGSIPPAADCLDGTVVQSYATPYIPASGSSVAIFDNTGSAPSGTVYSYRVCIVSKSNQLTSFNTLSSLYAYSSVIFVSSQLYSTSNGQVTNTSCQAAANSSGAAVPVANYKVVVGNPSANITSSVTFPVFNANQELVALNYAQFFGTGSNPPTVLSNPIVYNEFGQDQRLNSNNTTTATVTNMTPSGTYDSKGAYGYFNTTDKNWTFHAESYPAFTHIYCVSQ